MCDISKPRTSTEWVEYLKKTLNGSPEPRRFDENQWYALLARHRRECPDLITTGERQPDSRNQARSRPPLGHRL